VPSTGLSVAVREYGGTVPAASGPHVVLVHGYPDNQEMWEPVAASLCAGGMHVVTYDVRGAGASDVPRETAGYRNDLLVDDLVAVLEAAVPDGERVHLVGHDWGSVQLWEAVLSERDDLRLKGRVASFTSISGPAIDHMAHLARNPRGRTLRLLRQLRRSWYVLFFQIPRLPELVVRLAHRPLGALTIRRDHGRGHDYWGPELSRDAAHGLNLYRANFGQGARLMLRSRPSGRRTDVPVLVVAPRRDPFLTALTTEDLDHLCSDVSVVRPDTGHWIPRTHPDLLADLVREHVLAHD
jgi:pimeloyl-ACP methyl ester carboxylesterase